MAATQFIRNKCGGVFPIKNIARYTLISILLVAALAKLVTASTESAAFGKADQVLSFLSARQAMLWSGVSETIAICLLLIGPELARVAITGVLAVGFTSYRLILSIGPFAGPCDCFGYFWNALGIATGDAIRYSNWLFVLYIIAFVVYAFCHYTDGYRSTDP